MQGILNQYRSRAEWLGYTNTIKMYTREISKKLETFLKNNIHDIINVGTEHINITTNCLMFSDDDTSFPD